jgi:hypothetical protein
MSSDFLLAIVLAVIAVIAWTAIGIYYMRRGQQTGLQGYSDGGKLWIGALVINVVPVFGSIVAAFFFVGAVYYLWTAYAFETKLRGR